jgi:sarcosine oxidase
VLGFD